ncbi:MAG: hypothetical protein V3V49_04190 [Candidatus Krumholzibacteria bacterium]
MNASTARADRLAIGNILALVGSLILAPLAWGAGGDVQWEDQVDQAGGFDAAFAITAPVTLIS